MKCLMRLVGAILLTTAAVIPAAPADGTRLTVLNEMIDPVPCVEHVFPLYLSRLGSYYAELYLQPEVTSRPQPVDLALTISFLQREDLLLSRDIAVRFAPGQIVATLFFLESPDDLPQRKNLDVVVKFRKVDPQLKDHPEAVRLQLTRKPQIVPFKP